MTTMTKSVDSVAVAPDKYKVLLENDRVRVMDLRLKPGDKIPMHDHPDMVVYPLTDVRNEFIFPDGTSKEVKLPKGEALFMEAFSHAAEHTGDEEARLILIELKG